MDMTYDEIELVVMYNILDKTEFIHQLNLALPETDDAEMREIMIGLIDKVSRMTAAEYKVMLDLGEAII